MIINDDIAKHYIPFNKTELMFKSFYESIEGNYAEQYIASINDASLRGFMYNVLASGNYHYSKITDLFFLYDDDIVIAKNTRYKPRFHHKHYFYEIIYQLQGRSSHNINNFHLHMDEGDFCIIPPGPLHTVSIFDDSIIINILIKPNSIDSLIDELLPRKSIFSDLFNNVGIFNSHINYIYVHSKDDLRLQQIVEEITLEDIKRQEQSSNMKKIMLLKFFNYVIRHYKNKITVNENINSFRSDIKSICQYIHTNYKRAVLNDIAKRFGYSPSYLSKLLHEITGLTFSEIVCREKITNACKLLATTDKKIFEISDTVGFENPENFSRAFKKSTGVTPKEYRSNYERLLSQNPEQP